MIAQEALSTALQGFRTTYPSITSADLQTFILGWQSAEKELYILNNIHTSGGLTVKAVFIKSLSNSRKLYCLKNRLVITNLNNKELKSMNIEDFIK